jgi:hypothetical protein
MEAEVAVVMVVVVAAAVVEAGERDMLLLVA